MIKGEPLYDPQHRPGTWSVLLRSTLALTAVAYTANLMLTFHTRWTSHSTAHAQYESLVKSEICRNSDLRIQSSQVNNCDLAERMVDGGEQLSGFNDL